MTATNPRLACKAIGILSAVFAAIVLCFALPQWALAEEEAPVLRAGEAPLGQALGSNAKAAGSLEFVGLSGASVTGSVSSGYTVYVRDGDTVTVDLAVKNPAGERLSYVNVADTPSYPQGDHAFEPIEFPHIYYGNIVPPVANTEYDSRQLRTSETTGIGYYGFDIEAGATATFTLNIKAGSLAKGTYNWNLQLGLKRYDYVKESEYEWPCVGTEVEEVYAQIPIKVVVYAQPDASLVVGENTGTEYSPVINQSAVIDFGTVDLAATDENGLKAARTIWAYNNSPAIATDSHGNTTSITVNFTGESDSIEASPFSWGNIYSGYQLYLYDTKWSPLPPAGLSGGGTSYASYSCVLDATYLIAGTYTGSFVVGRTPTTLKVNGTAIDASTIYRIPVTVTLTGTNPRLLPRATNLTATPGNGQVELAWTPAEGSSEYTEYTIYRRVGAETQADADKLDWSLYEEVGTKRVGYDADGMLWVDGEVENGVTYSYTVMCGTPKCGYASAAVTATPDASIQSRMLAPQSYASGALNAVEVMWVMNEKYGGRDFDGSGMVDHFNVYRDGVLVDQVYQSAVEDDVSYGWHDDGTGTDTQVYGITGHSYSWTVKEPVPELYVSYRWTVSAVSPSGVESYLDEEAMEYAYSDVPVILGHEAYFDDEYYVYANLEEFDDVPAIAMKIDNRVGYNPAEELVIWKSVGTAAPDTSQTPYITVPAGYNDEYGSNVHYADKNVVAGNTYTYTVRAIGAEGEESDFYTFTVKALTPTEDDYFYFTSPNVEWSVLGGTTARLKFNPQKSITATVYRNGTKLSYTPEDGYYNWQFDVQDDPGADGTYVYRVDYTCSGITTSREFTFVRNTQPADVDSLLKPPDAPTLSARTSGGYNVILSWTPAATGGVPEGYHIYRSDGGKPVLGGRYVLQWHWDGYTENWASWGNSRYMTIQDGGTLTFVDGTTAGEYYKGDKLLGRLNGLYWNDDDMPHEYYITAYNRAGESAPSQVIVFDAYDEDGYGNHIAPANPADELPAAPEIERAWIDWNDFSSFRSGFAAWLYGDVHVAWSDSGMGGDIDSWTATFAGTHVEDNNLNPPQTDKLEFHTASLYPTAKQGLSDEAPKCSINGYSGSNGDLGRTIAVTVAAENGAGSVTSESLSVQVNSLPRFYALPDNGGALLKWTDLADDAATQVIGWEIWRKAEYGLWECAATLPGSLAYAGTEKDSNNSTVSYYAWADSGLDNGWTYQYQVVAKCADGIDRPSVVREVTPEHTAAVEAPGAPQNLQAQVRNGIVYLTWDKPETGGAVSYYCPQVKGESIDWFYGTVGNVAGNNTSTTWMPGSPGTYKVAVWAYASVDGKQLPSTLSSWQIDGYDNMTDDEKLDALYPNHSNVVEVTITQDDIDSRPSGSLGDFSITLAPGEGQVVISWTACENAVVYEIERHNDNYPKMPDVKIAAVPGQQVYTYVDDTAEPGVRYRYQVTARNAGGSGLYREGHATAAGKTHDQQVAEQVEALIAALPEPADVAVEDAERIAGVQEIWDSLTAKQRALVNAELAQKLADVVEAVEQLSLLARYAELVAPVQALIDALPDASQVTAEDAGQIQAAREAYEALVPEEAKRIVKIARLVAAEQVLADQEAAAAVAALIDALPSLDGVESTDSAEIARARAAVDAARTAYDKLTSSQIGYLPEAYDLRLSAYEEALGKLEKDAADRAAAQEVNDAIGALPDADALQLADRALVEAVRAAYEALSDEAKAMVESYGDLVAAEEKLAILQKEADEQAAEHVRALIDALPGEDSLSPDDRAAIDAALAAYAQLTDEQKALIDQDLLARLTKADAVVKQKEKEAAEAARIDIAGGQATLSASSFTYDGSAKKPTVKLVVNGKTLTAGKDFTVSYARNVNAGTAQVTLAGIGGYKGAKSVGFTIKRAVNTLSAKAKSKQVKASAKKLKKKKVVVKKAKAFAIANPVGAVTFKKIKGNKKISVSKAGKVTLKKGLKKGLYKVKVRVSADGSGNYLPAYKDVMLKIRVK